MIAPKNEKSGVLSDAALWGIAEMAEDAIGNWVAREIEGDENQKRESLRVMRELWEVNDADAKAEPKELDQAP